jgi:RNA polymerase sigma factor for flagellar operon FliA
MKYEYSQCLLDDFEKEQYVEEFIPKIKAWVNRIGMTLPDSVDKDDLYSAACMGLVESMKRFNKSLNVDFKAYAERRIKGAILDNLRQLDFLPRNLRHQVKHLEKVISELSTKLGRKPTPQEIIDNTEYDEDIVYKLLDVIESGHIGSLDINVGEDKDVSLVEFIKFNGYTPEEEYEKKKLVEYLGEKIDNLSEKERLVVTLYYYEELTMKEIGEILDITESRISQIHSSALKKLKKKVVEFYE